MWLALLSDRTVFAPLPPSLSLPPCPWFVPFTSRAGSFSLVWGFLLQPVLYESGVEDLSAGILIPIVSLCEMVAYRIERLLYLFKCIVSWPIWALAGPRAERGLFPWEWFLVGNSILGLFVGSPLSFPSSCSCHHRSCCCQCFDLSCCGNVLSLSMGSCFAFSTVLSMFVEGDLGRFHNCVMATLLSFSPWEWVIGEQMCCCQYF